MVGILNPYDMMHDAQAWIGQHWMILAILAVLISLVAAFMLNNIWDMWQAIPVKDRSFKRGKSNFSQSLRMELLERIKRKRKI